MVKVSVDFNEKIINYLDIFFIKVIDKAKDIKGKERINVNKEVRIVDNKDSIYEGK